jgi:transposase
MINPKYSSQRCSSCGFIHEDNRISQSKFICLECKVEMNADYNASKNISIAHTEEYVKEIENHSKAIEKFKKLNKEEKNVEEMLQV